MFVFARPRHFWVGAVMGWAFLAFNIIFKDILLLIE